MALRIEITFGFLLTTIFASFVLLEEPNILKSRERRDETGLLTVNEALLVGRNMCIALQNLVDLVNNPIAALLGLSDLALNTAVPIPRWVLNPLGIVTFVDSLKRTMLDFINRANILNLNLGKRDEPLDDGTTTPLKSGREKRSYIGLSRKRKVRSLQSPLPVGRVIPLSKRQASQEEEQKGETLTIRDLIELAKIPCEMVEFTQSIFNDTPVAWVGAGHWPLLLRDVKNDLNLMAVPRRFLQAVFSGR